MAGERQETPEMKIWFRYADWLFRELFPQGAGEELCGIGMDAESLFALDDRESERVEETLFAMAESGGVGELKEIVSKLGRDTLIGLFSRWLRCYQIWEGKRFDPDHGIFVPPNRVPAAIFLAMTQDPERALSVRKRLWPEVFSDR